MTRARYRIEWQTPLGRLSALEPTPAELAAHAAELALAYNDPVNAPLLGHTEEYSPEDVIESYTELEREGGHFFFAYRDSVLIGDADLRSFRDGSAELAFMIGAPPKQGKGLGTRFATLVVHFGFMTLGLERIYASIVPGNVASRRVFEKLGFRIDDSPAAREFAEGASDIVMLIDRAAFERLPDLAGIEIGPR
jgi:RimJ/RimL family protein N-acetyltransferase